MHNKSVAAKSHYAFKSNFLGSPQLANKLDKNADADLVTATLYFNELQAQLAKFINSVEKIVETNPTKGEKLKQIAKTFLSDTIANLN